MLVSIAEWATTGVAVALILAGAIFIRRNAATAGGVTYAVLASNALYVIAMAAVLVGGYSPLHLLWLFPVAWVGGFLVLAPPFSWILVPLGRAYGAICCAGGDGA